MKRWLLVIAIALGAAPVASAEPPHTHEIIYNRPSGFWTSNRPAVGGAYRYRLLLLGVGISSLTGYLLWKLIKNTKR